ASTARSATRRRGTSGGQRAVGSRGQRSRGGNGTHRARWYGPRFATQRRESPPEPPTPPRETLPTTSIGRPMGPRNWRSRPIVVVSSGTAHSPNGSRDHGDATTPRAPHRQQSRT